MGDGSLYIAFSTQSPVAVRVNYHTDWITALAWSPDESQLVTGSADHTARLWDRTTGESTAVLRGHPAAPI